MALSALLGTIRAVKQCSARCQLHLKETYSLSLPRVKGFCNPFSRNYYTDKFKVSPKTCTKLQASDGVPNSYTLIYTTPLETFLKWGYPVVLFCTIGGPCVASYDYFTKGTTIFQNKKLANDTKLIRFLGTKYEVFIYLGAMMLFAAAAFGVLFKTPFRIYKHSIEQKYVAIFLSPIPFKLRQFQFKMASQTKFKNPLYTFFEQSHYLIEKKKVLIFPYCFRTPADLCDMLGVD